VARDLRTLDPEAIRDQIAVVQQDTYLFTARSRESAPRQAGGERSELEAAARAANAQ